VALLAPLAMPIAARAGVPAFLMALAVANGANAGNLSPISSVGLIANGKMAAAGLAGHEFKVWFANFASHLLVTAVAYLVLRGYQRRPATEGLPEPADPGTLTKAHWLTVVVVVCWGVGVIGFRLPVGLTGFAAAAVLVLARAAEDQVAIRKMPWGVMLMVCGMSVLVGVLEQTGGLGLFTSLLAKLASASNLNGVIAFVTGSISTYSSTSGVVLPTFLPTVPGLVAQVGGSDPLAVALSINVGSSLVDVSPLSTLGALCVAAVADPTKSQRLFQRLLVWGLGMSVVGAGLCQVLAGPFSRW
jgi:Na+/H+ antiporter NhaD/arsenite permease-like protein